MSTLCDSNGSFHILVYIDIPLCYGDAAMPDQTRQYTYPHAFIGEIVNECASATVTTGGSRPRALVRPIAQVVICRSSKPNLTATVWADISLLGASMRFAVQ
jgi:hypothetical protein